ncbi:MAG: enoyl-CoA hydratase/isomerase family protein [Anaerolineae bacterium]|nr:MAG: enoyl-CoA hydratase/isomerase family protein [Anaerolineae bacterium]
MILLDTPYPGVAQLTVNRPQVRNALDWETMDAFADAVTELAGRSDVRALVVCGAHGTFLSGGDLRALHDATGEAAGARLVAGMTRSLERLAALPYPVFAALDGAARGGGAEVALACDVRVMAQDATLGFVQVRLGLMPGWGGAQRLLRLVGYGRALLWLTTGEVLDAAQAYAAGLVEALAPTGGALPAALELARQVAAQSPQAVQAIKRTLRAHLDGVSPAWSAALEQAAFPPLWAHPYHQQAVKRFLQRKEGNDDAV